jgi:hypothetical protein
MTSDRSGGYYDHMFRNNTQADFGNGCEWSDIRHVNLSIARDLFDSGHCSQSVLFAIISQQ